MVAKRSRLGVRTGPPQRANPSKWSRFAWISVGTLAIVSVTFWLGPLRGGASSDPVIAAAGDISCPQGPDGTTSCRDEATSDLLLTLNPKWVLTLGDNQYPSGSLANYDAYYDPTWGRLKGSTKPAPGNHEYNTSGAAGYFDYYGSTAGDGYYSFDVGQWHVISLNSEIPAGTGSAQYTWLKSDLTRFSDRTCTLAYWHKARWGSSDHGSLAVMKDIWNLLYDRHADLVLSGHNHEYERFAPLNETGQIDRAHGIVEFVVGTGGKDHVNTLKPPITGSQKQDNQLYGILKLVLHPTSFDWSFLAAPSGTVIESGAQTCNS